MFESRLDRLRDRLLGEALSAYERGLWADAFVRARDVRDIDPENAEARRIEELASRRADAPHDLDVVGERRRMTVLFTDLVDSTGKAVSLDPEVYRDVLRVYQRIAVDALHEHEGTVGRYLGDGVICYFGYPIAHEDDARRAVAAALQLVQGVEAAGPEFERRFGLRLAVRVGLHTGLVVVTDNDALAARLLHPRPRRRRRRDVLSAPE